MAGLGGGWELDLAHGGCPSSSSSSSTSQPRLSVKTYSSDVFTTCVLFLFYIGEENVFFLTQDHSGKLSEKCTYSYEQVEMQMK